MTNLLQAKALFEFESGGPGELSFSTDELLTIVRQVKRLRYTSDLFVIIISVHVIRPLCKAQ